MCEKIFEAFEQSTKDAKIKKVVKRMSYLSLNVGDSKYILSSTLGEVFPYSTLGPRASGGVWKYFTSSGGKYICTVPPFRDRHVSNSGLICKG